jgi:tryptophan synthase beta chain
MILDQIVAHKRTELPRSGDFPRLRPATRSLRAHLRGRHHLIAEIKRRSPSAGELGGRPVRELAHVYDRYASAISVVTDRRFFGGDPADIRRVKAVTALPVLRKDFIIDEAQILESRALGADAVLLIVALLSDDELRRFIDIAAGLGMDSLVEVHTAAELDRALAADAGIIGINNRDLSDFRVDLETTLRLKERIPADRLVVSESGIASLADVVRLDTHAVLVGTTLMRAGDPAERLAALRRPRVKVCGVTRPEDAAAAVAAGADYIGFNFYPGSPRYIDPKQAAAIAGALPNTVATVGVFVDAPRAEVQRVAAAVGLDLLQFHGGESPARCRGWDRPVIKAFRVGEIRPDSDGYRVFARLFDSGVGARFGGTGRAFDHRLLNDVSGKVFLAGGLGPDNAADIGLDPFAVDACSGLEAAPGIKDSVAVERFVRAAKDRTRFGRFGGRFVPETLMAALDELEAAWGRAMADPEFRCELARLLAHYAGRPTPLYLARNFSAAAGGRVYLKREDLLHGGAHKTNNVLGQMLLARAMGKTRIVAETGAGQHGIAVAMAGALFRLPVEVYMGVEDMGRQRVNVERMRLCGAVVTPVETSPGRGTLKDAVSQALRDWTANVRTTYYLLGSVAGPHPYPALVRDFQRVIGREARAQILAAEGRLPDAVVACVGGGSNAIGIFDAFLGDAGVRLVGVEAGGDGVRHGASLGGGREGIFQGARTMVLQDADGQIGEAHSVSAGLDYPGVGPQHAHLHRTGRAEYAAATDAEAVAAFRLLARAEGIIPALESAHALAHVLKMNFGPDDVVVVNLSGRGDKDLATVEAQP